jgi:hypothetical protein
LIVEGISLKGLCLLAVHELSHFVILEFTAPPTAATLPIGGHSDIAEMDHR